VALLLCVVECPVGGSQLGRTWDSWWGCLEGGQDEGWPKNAGRVLALEFGEWMRLG
jgi:hypothetical protein